MEDNPVQRPWNPLTPEEVMGLFVGASFQWWIAGGYAIELAVGYPFREHEDIDILVLRRDLSEVRAFLGHWDCWVADPPGTLRPWQVGEHLPITAHDIWCRKSHDDDWRFQLMADESSGERWQSRRDSRISLPINQVGIQTSSGIPYLLPEIQLFYKAKSSRSKDLLDLRTALPKLSSPARTWLTLSLTTTYGWGHDSWLQELGG